MKAVYNSAMLDDFRNGLQIKYQDEPIGKEDFVKRVRATIPIGNPSSAQQD
jgi:hypothetical protein